VRVYSRAELSEAVETIAADGFCADIADIARAELHHWTPPESISTAECAVEYRVFPASQGSGKNRYSLERTPYNLGPMNELDDPECNLLVMVKPSRSGGTTVAENYLFKMIKFGPMETVGWYLSSDDAVKKYVELVVKPMFDNHPDLAAKIGTGRSDNNDKSKRINGHLVEWLAANDNNFRNREPGLMVLDESDGYGKRFAATPVVNIKNRQKQLGNRKKGIVMSHPDKGWASGSAAAWIDTSRGIFIMRCVQCRSYASAHSTKYWPDVPEFKLHYLRDEEAPRDKRLDMAERTASMACPYCGATLTDAERRAMVDEALLEERWMHRGQTLDIDNGIIGERTLTAERGAWIHGLMLKTVTMAELAKEWETALIQLETTGKSTTLREFMSKALGEIYDGTKGAAGATSASLRKRANDEYLLKVGQCPPWVKFITSAVDVGAGKFDVSFRGWDLEGRSVWLDRFTIRQRRWADGIMRDIRTRERIEDWDVLYEQVIDRKFPIIGRPGLAMPVAVVTVDVGDGNVTWKGREFARRTLAAGRFWGSPSQPWAIVRPIQGSSSAKAPALPLAPTKIDKDEHGQVLKPIVLEYTLGVHDLKEAAVERLGVDDGGPGQCVFADGIAANYFDEFFNERLIDGKWERSGPNESLDLFAYEDAGRQMLKPDRKDINWDTALPPWARPVSVKVEGGDLRIAGEGTSKPPALPASSSASDIFSRFDALNNGDTGGF
jgi:phage terminase large subunit GpA-like protein